MKLRQIAYAVSGDKGTLANVGVIAYSEADYAKLVDLLSEQRVLNHFKWMHPKRVVRYELPNLWALNFVLEGVLDGGLRGLSVDAQGKSLGQKILELEI